MGNINLGFHATADEIAQMVYKAIQQYNLVVVVAKIWPEFQFEILSQFNYEIDLKYISTARFVFLCTETPKGLMDNYNEFLSQNSDNLVIQIGEMTEESIRESTIGTRCQDSSKLRIWKNIINMFKKEMHQGVWVNNTKNGEKKYYKNNYYTTGAQTAYLHGLIMKAFAGFTEYQLLEPKE